MSESYPPAPKTVGATCARACESCRPVSQVITEVKTPLPKVIQPNNKWAAVRGSLAFGLACLTSPCCTPLIVPLGLALLAGTPVAGWLAYNLGWVYGALTFVSLISFVIAFRWWLKPGSKSP